MQLEDVREFLVVGLGPEVQPIPCIDQVRGDANALACRAHATFEDRTDTQIPRNLADICIATFVSEGGSPCGDLQPLYPDECADQLFSHAIAEVVLRGIAGEIGEGQHRDGGAGVCFE